MMHYLNLSLDNIESEIWIPITGYEGFYEISNMGRIKGIDRVDCMGQFRKTKISKQCFDKNKYLLISLSRDRIDKTFRVHRLVGFHFIPNPENKKEINHKKGIKTDNRASELEWSTNKENIHHSISIGIKRSIKGESNPGAIINQELALKIFNYQGKLRHVASHFNIDKQIVSRIKRGLNWSHVTGKYYNNG